MSATADRSIPPSTEAALVDAVCAALRAEGWQTFTEVGLMTRSVDAVAVDPSGTVMAIEFKLRDWRSAVRQVQDHKVSCEMVAICMPRMAPTDLMRTVLEQEGIGFLGYDPSTGSLEFVLEPRPSAYYWETAGKWLTARLEARGAAE